MATPDTVQPDFANDPLDDVAVRVLGSLIEKEFTTPDNYPLSVNAVTAACNQSSNRDPVMALDEAAVTAALRALSARGLAREVHRSDSRVKRYRHALQDTLTLHPAELASLCILLLRGPQTVGEIKGRTGRMVEFIDLSHVEITLQGMMDRPVPLVVQLERQPGQKEARYAHLLSGEPQVQAAPVLRADATDEPAEPGRIEALEQEVASLREQLEELRAQFDAFREEFR